MLACQVAPLKIKNLTPGNPIPEEVLEKVELASLAESLLRLSHEPTSQEHCAGSQVPTLEGHQTKIQILVRDQVLLRIIDQGILNYHQVSQDKIDFVPNSQFRSKLEDSLLGFTIEKQWRGPFFSRANSLRPKYGILSIDDLPSSAQPTRRIPPTYGNVVLVLKDDLKKRITLSRGDSVNAQVPFTGISLMDDCRPDLLLPIYYSLPEAGPKPIPSFLEVQVWGPIEASDIDYAIVNCPALEHADPSQLAKAMRSGLRIFECIQDSIEEHAVRFRKGNCYNFGAR